MKALVYHGPGRRAWEDVADAAVVDAGDAVVKVDAVTICGTDLHILAGDVAEVSPGRVLGHEAVGTVTAIGSGVRRVAVGDQVLVSCISSCGSCRYCRDRSYGQCLGGGGWILGHLIDGVQAESVRGPFADNSTYPVPPGLSRADDHAGRHLAHVIRGGCAQRRSPARRRGGDRRRGPDRAGRDPYGRAAHAEPHRGH